MRRFVLTILVLVLVAPGCQDRHRKNKQAATDRWNTARAQLGIDLAHQQFKAGELDKATAAVHNILENNIRYVPAHLLLGRIQLEQNQLDQARLCFERCLALELNNAQAHYYLGILYERGRRLDTAFGHYHQAWLSRPDHIHYLLAAAEIRFGQGHYQQAWELLAEHLGRVQDTSLYILAGNILTARTDHKAAVAMFRHAADLSPDNEDISLSLAFALHHTGRAAEAAELFEQLRDDAKDNGRKLSWPCYLALGDCYVQLGKFHQAQRCFEYVTTHDTSNPTAWTRLAQTAMARNHLERARLHAQKALALSPGDSDAIMVLGYLAIKKQDYEQAERIFRRIIGRDRTNALAYCLLGRCLQARGLDEQALDCYALALKINPDDKLARKLMVAAQNSEFSDATIPRVGF